MIVVFSELGGERLLGRSRQIADSLGVRVLAVCAGKEKAEKLISLGADEVGVCGANTVADWVRVLADLTKTEVKMLLLPSGTLGNSILGGVYALARDRVGSFIDSADSISELEASKTLHPSGVVLHSSAREERVSLWSVKISSVAEPFEDASRYGKVREIVAPVADSKITPPVSLDSNSRDSTSELTILVGNECPEGVKGIANRYAARLVQAAGRVQVINGPCLAIEVNSPLRDLPEFQGELISLNSTEAPISRVSKLAAVTSQVQDAVAELALSHG